MAPRVAKDPSALPALIQKARPGDRILLAPGTWNDVAIVFETNGTEKLPITLAAEVPGTVRLTGNSSLRVQGSWLMVHGLHFPDATASGQVVRLDGYRSIISDLVIQQGTATSEESKWISVHGMQNEVRNCYLAGKRNPGATLVIWLARGAGEAPRHKIQHNNFGPRSSLGQNGGETIRVGDSATSMQRGECLVSGNLFEECDGEIEVVSNKSCGNVYRENTFIACAGTLTLRHGNGCRVMDNVFLGRGKKESGGVRILGEDHWVESNHFEALAGHGARAAISLVRGIVDTPLNGYAQVKRAIVSSNSIQGCAEAIAFGVAARGATLDPIDCWIESNLIDQKQGPSPAPLSSRQVGPAWWRARR